MILLRSVPLAPAPGGTAATTESKADMARRKSKTGQLALRMGINDERIPKLLGIFCLFLALYLFIAFTSYLFTWEEDQDKVFRFSWGELIAGEYEMANWLGRLGAVVSNAFFYWGFGIASYVFVALLGIFGWSQVKRDPTFQLGPTLRFGFLLVIALSIFFAFVFQSADFPWGGAFGSMVAAWLESFVGAAGLIVLFLFIILGILMWTVNPNLNETTPRQLLLDARNWAGGLFNKRYRPVERREAAPERPAPLRERPAPAPAAETLRPSGNARVLPGGPGLALPEGTLPNGEQLALEMEERKDRQRAATLRTGAESTLEIAVPTPEPVSTPAEATNALVIEEGSGPLNPDKLSVERENKDLSEPYDPTLELSTYEHPVTSLLEDYADQKVEVDRAELEANKDQIIETLLNYKIEITNIRATIGPTVTLYEIVPAPGVRISKIKNLEDDIALSLAALGIRIIAPIPGRGTIGIEVPNKKKQIVSLKEVLLSDKFKQAKMDLPIALGKTISNDVFVADLAKMPHLLIAGATGQGKSVGINTIIMSILYKKHPSQVKLVLVDPKKVELFPYSALENHFLSYLPGQDEPITTETNKVIHTLNSLCIEMDQRYNLMKKAHARNIKEYNKKFIERRLNPNKGHYFMPFIVLVIDEFADLIMTAGKEVELPIGRLAQLARAVGIHLIIATQRPSVNIITGVIKANFPARLAFKVTSKVDSRTILDGGGADQLIGRGDMLLSVGGDVIRLQCAFVDTPEVEQVIKFIADQRGYPEPYFLPEFHGDDEDGAPGAFNPADLDENFEDAARLIVQNQHGSTSMIQRRLKLGYNRAGRIMDQLEAVGIVGPSEGSKAREVLVYDEMELERYLTDLKNRK